VTKKQTDKQTKQEINMHHLRGNAIPAGPLSDFVIDGFLLKNPFS